MSPLAENVSTVSHVIQLAVAPVFLLTGIGAILSVLTGRLGRVIDRLRLLTEKHDLKNEGVEREIRTLSKRAKWVHWAITLCTMAALLISIIIAILFLGTQLPFDPSGIVAPIFIITMLCLIVGLICFLREIYLSIHTFELP